MIFNNPEFLANRETLQSNYKKQLQRDSFQGELPEKNFDTILQSKVPESMNTAADSTMNKKRKNAEEVMDDYSEIKDDQHDSLALESHIRKIFRKMRIKTL